VWEGRLHSILESYTVLYITRSYNCAMCVQEWSGVKTRGNAPMRSYFTATPYGRSLYVFGGQADDKCVLATVLCVTALLLL
jgi:hypothetical protein